VGPELVCAAWAARSAEGLRPFAVIGGAEILKSAAIRRGLDMPVHAISDIAAATRGLPDALPVLAGSDGDYRP